MLHVHKTQCQLFVFEYDFSNIFSLHILFCNEGFAIPRMHRLEFVLKQPEIFYLAGLFISGP